MVYFVLLGTAVATWNSRIPAIKHALHLSNGALGLALFSIPCGSAATLPVMGRLADRFGAAALLRVAGPLMAVSLVGPGLARSLLWLMVALATCGVCAGLLDVTMNAAGARLERVYGRPIMSSLHAGYSLAALIGGGLGGLFASVGIGALATFAAAAVPLAAIGVIAARWVVAPDARQLSPAEPGAAGAGPRTPGAAGPASPGTPRLPGMPAPRAADANATTFIWIFGLMALCGQAGEGAAGDWSTVYLHDNLHTSAGFAVMGVIGFSVAMTAGRLAGDRFAARFGPARLVRWSGLVAAAGLSGGVLYGSPPCGVAGFTLLGAGLAIIFPQLVAAAGRLDPVHTGRNFARIAGIGYTGLLGGPVIIGFAAGAAGLQAALFIPAALALVVAACAGTLRVPAAGA